MNAFCLKNKATFRVKRVCLIVVAVFLVGIGTQQKCLANSIPPEPNQLEQLFSSQLGKWMSVLTHKVNEWLQENTEFLGPFGGIFQAYLGEAFDLAPGEISAEIKGALGLPDPQKVQTIVAGQSTTQLAPLSASLAGNSNSLVRDEIQTMLSASLAKTTAQNLVLSTEAQQKSSEKLQSASAIVKKSLNIAKANKQETISQKVLANMSAQISQGQILDLLILGELKKSQVTDATIALALAELLQKTQEEKLRGERQKIADAQMLINQTGLTIPGGIYQI